MELEKSELKNINFIHFMITCGHRKVLNNTNMNSNLVTTD